MPEIIHYVVTETRSVEVTANNVEDACRIAAAAFKDGQNADTGVRKGLPNGVFGNTISWIKIHSMLAERKR